MSFQTVIMLCILYALLYLGMNHQKQTLEDIRGVSFRLYEDAIRLSDRMERINGRVYRLFTLIYAGATKEDLRTELKEMEAMFAQADAENRSLIAFAGSVSGHQENMAEKLLNRLYRNTGMNPETGTGKDRIGILNEILKNTGEYRRLIMEAVEVIQAGDFDVGAMMLLGCDEVFDRMEAGITVLTDLERKHAQNGFSSALAAYRKTIGASLTVMVLITLFSFIISIRNNNMITSPLIRIIRGLIEGMDLVNSASAQTASAGVSLSRSASAQAAAVEEISSSLQQMASMSRQNARQAELLQSRMNETNKTVSAAEGMMAELTASISSISDSSKETGMIVKTIDDIAFQTNLLALNAAVEAARAGDAGSGFAVVANEVRNLAMRAAQAAKNTSGLLEDTIRKTERGTHLLTQTNGIFQQLSRNAGDVAGFTRDIASASAQQHLGIEEINRAVSGMDKGIQQNAAHAEQSAEASESLKNHSGQINTSISSLIHLVGSRHIQKK